MTESEDKLGCAAGRVRPHGATRSWSRGEPRCWRSCTNTTTDANSRMCTYTTHTREKAPPLPPRRRSPRVTPHASDKTPPPPVRHTLSTSTLPIPRRWCLTTHRPRVSACLHLPPRRISASTLSPSLLHYHGLITITLLMNHHKLNGF